MLAAQGRQAEGAVLVVVAGRVLLAAGAEHPDVEHPDGGGEHPVPAQARLAEPPDDLVADVAELGAQRQHAVVLDHVAGPAPLVVVAVLAAAGRVGAQRLDVAVRGPG